MYLYKLLSVSNSSLRYVRRENDRTALCQPLSALLQRCLPWTPSRLSSWTACATTSGSIHLTAGDPAAFDPLVDLVCRLPALLDLAWCLPMRVPPALVRISPPQGRFRLQVEMFDLRSLHVPIGQQPRDEDMDAEDYALLTAPRLHRIGCPDLWEFDIYGNWNYNEEAIAQALVSPQARSRVEHILVEYREPGDALGTRDALQASRASWPGLFLLSSSDSRSHGDRSFPASKRPLKTLSLDNNRGMTLQILERWDEVVDLSALLHLDLGLVRPELVPTLRNMAGIGALASLQTLKLTLDLFENDDPRGTTKDLCSVIKALRPLRSLHLGRTNSRAIFDALLGAHGPHLRELSLDEPIVLTSQNAHRLAKVCSRLRELNVTIRRSGGDESEVAFYKALGHLSRLESVSITLDCTRPDSDITGLIKSGEFSTDKYDRETSIRLVQDALVNVAIDEDLARSIFLAIARTQKRRADEIGLRQFMLRRVVVECPDSNLFDSHSEFSTLLQWLRGHWVCESSVGLGDPDCIFNPGGQARTIVTARDKGAQRKTQYEDWLFAYLDEIDPLVEDAWLRLWPCEHGEWKRSWKGRPLASNASYSSGPCDS
ncbi:uncharacterized protein F5Z01DRAFT_287660 [Emericellopsis atlantica]|uniref:Uncharacterized protein n=1 Tax=Emericellopsis atlantica TaxID=2614577 RepID=A0A9P8CL51_9HYPO|nr:uncharacterized protein F5Z01DRAFT_287660 [Emericellopsis atlantica]KAG9251249.1 hypothetical protein F5Z01DRAFT_287660 [Emericellopsis atlantica]